MQIFAYFGDFSRPVFYFRLKCDIMFELNAPVFL